MQINIIDPKNWNVVHAISDPTKKYYENIEYHMNSVDSRLKIKIKNIDCLNQKVFIEFVYDNRKVGEKEDFREDYIYELDVIHDVSYGLKINGICEENTKFVKFECGILDKYRKQK